MAATVTRSRAYKNADSIKVFNRNRIVLNGMNQALDRSEYYFSHEPPQKWILIAQIEMIPFA